MTAGAARHRRRMQRMPPSPVPRRCRARRTRSAERREAVSYDPSLRPVHSRTTHQGSRLPAALPAHARHKAQARRPTSKERTTTRRPSTKSLATSRSHQGSRCVRAEPLVGAQTVCWAVAVAGAWRFERAQDNEGNLFHPPLHPCRPLSLSLSSRPRLPPALPISYPSPRA